MQEHQISTHAPAGGATALVSAFLIPWLKISTHAPAGGATSAGFKITARGYNISTHAPAGGATEGTMANNGAISKFLLTPLREGRRDGRAGVQRDGYHFYSRPCGRGDETLPVPECLPAGFLLTPLREGRHGCEGIPRRAVGDFYSRPCGRGDGRCRPRST